MGFLEKLKTIGIDISVPKLTKLLHINFSFTIDNSIKVENSTVTINPGKFNGKQRKRLQELIRNLALEESGAILDADYTEEVNEVIKALPGIDETARKFITIIPACDVPLLRACLFLRQRFHSGGSVASLKDQIAQVYGPKGRNFANLCSAGYLEDWFWPLYEHLLTSYPDDPEVAKAKFQMLYNNIVNELPWTEFASIGGSPATLKSHIAEKMCRNVQNGVRFLNVHGLGERNVKKVLQILPELQKETGCTIGRMEQEKDRIFVRLEATRRLEG